MKLLTSQLGLAVFWIVLLAAGWLFVEEVQGRNIIQYSDTISNSQPTMAANHTFTFRPTVTIPPSARIEITAPPDFTLTSEEAFDPERNIELLVDGNPRTVEETRTAFADAVDVFPGTPGVIHYHLNTGTGIPEGSQVELRIGTQTTLNIPNDETTFSTTTGTTTVLGGIPPIINATTTGRHTVDMRIVSGATEIANAGFVIWLLEPVGVGPVDTTNLIPPFRFNGSPTTTVTGVTANVELFVETDERAICKYATEPGVAYDDMPLTFTGTGLIYHTVVVPIEPNTIQEFYVRCMDEELNQNTDDYLIIFTVDEFPTGSANTDGDVSGDGSGTGNEGTGDGSGGGGQTGDSSGEAPTQGGSAGTGGSGGGGGGGSGGGSGGGGGGGFESTPGPFESGDARLVVSGLSSPGARVTTLVDGQEADTVTANSDGVFSFSIDGIARGAYTFGIYAIDRNNNRSSTFSTSFTVSGARTSALSNIILPPSFSVSPDPADPGDEVVIAGYTLPGATVTVENERQGSAASRTSQTTTADSSGRWSVIVPTSGFSVGTYQARAKSAPETSSRSSSFSQFVAYGVGEAAATTVNADLNRDSRVNLIDFSILLFWWGSDGGTSDPSADLNGDNRVNLVDFSILLFNWTG